MALQASPERGSGGSMSASRYMVRATCVRPRLPWISIRSRRDPAVHRGGPVGRPLLVVSAAELSDVDGVSPEHPLQLRARRPERPCDGAQVPAMAAQQLEQLLPFVGHWLESTRAGGIRE